MATNSENSTMNQEIDIDTFYEVILRLYLEYIYKGKPWEMNRLSYIPPEDNPYQRDILIQCYLNYNNSVLEYFRHRPNDLLVLNISNKGAYGKLCLFLNKPVTHKEFPWENKTSEIKK